MTSKTASYPELPDSLTAFLQLSSVCFSPLFSRKAAARGGEYTNEPPSGKPYLNFFAIIFRLHLQNRFECAKSRLGQLQILDNMTINPAEVFSEFPCPLAPFV